MKYLITGATGLVGSELLNYLKTDKQNKIYSLIHNKTLRQSNNIYTVTGDLLDINSLKRIPKDIDIIFHCAAAINADSPEDYYKINVEGTRNLLKAAKLEKVKLFVYFSSWAVNPLAGDYANSKYLAEKEVRKFKKYLIIRPSDIFSDNKSHLYDLVNYVKKLPVVPIIGDGKYIVSPIYVKDLINSIFYLIKNNKVNETYTVIGPQVYTFNQIISLIQQYLKVNKLIIQIPKKIIYPIIYITDKLHIPFPFTTEKYKRLSSKKIMEKVLSFSESKIKPLNFETALTKFKIR